MRYKEITESPIGNLEVHNMDQPGTFPDSDRKLLTDPDYIKKVRKRFENVPYLFDLYFVNQPNAAYTYRDENIDFFTTRWYDDLKRFGGMRTPDFIEKHFGVKVAADPQAITVVFLSNANEENTIRMTPWIVAHRFAHALNDNLDTLPPDLRRLMQDFPEPSSSFLTMRSAQTGKLLSSDVPQELFAQYLMTGFVVLKPPVGIKNQEALNHRLHRLESEITHRIDSVLQACVGRVLVSV